MPRPWVLAVLAGLLLAYGNALALADRYLFPGTWPFPAIMGPLLTALLVAYGMKGLGLSLEELGLGPRRALTSGALGLLVGSALAGPAVLFLRFPLIMEGPLIYRPLEGVEVADVLLRVLVTMPLDTVMVEEVAFRGLLLALLLRLLPVGGAVLLCSALFVLWHPVVNFHTLTHTNLVGHPGLLALGLVGAHMAVFAGGVLFSLLRLGTRHLAGPMAAHWAANGWILLGLALF